MIQNLDVLSEIQTHLCENIDLCTCSSRSAENFIQEISPVLRFRFDVLVLLNLSSNLIESIEPIRRAHLPNLLCLYLRMHQVSQMATGSIAWSLSVLPLSLSSSSLNWAAIIVHSDLPRWKLNLGSEMHKNMQLACLGVVRPRKQPGQRSSTLQREFFCQIDPPLPRKQLHRELR